MTFLVCPNGRSMDYPGDSVCRRVPLSVSLPGPEFEPSPLPVTSSGEWRGQIARSADARFGTGFKRAEPSCTRDGAGVHPRRSPIRNFMCCVTGEALSGERIRAEDNHEFVFVGRSGWKRGGISPALRREKRVVPLRVIGDGPMRAELQRAYPEFTFDGWCCREVFARLANVARAWLCQLVTRNRSVWWAVRRCGGLARYCVDRALLLLRSTPHKVGFATIAGQRWTCRSHVSTWPVTTGLWRE